MMDMDKMTLNLADSEPLAEAFSRQEVGSKVPLCLTIDGKDYELEANIDEIDPGKMAVLSLTTEEAEASEPAAKDEAEGEPVDAALAAADSAK